MKAVTISERNFWLQTNLIFVALCVLQLTTWLPLRFWKIWGGGNFLDTWQILRYGQCYESVGLSVYENGSSTCSNYLYGRVLLQILSFFGVSASATQLIGYSFLFLISISLTLLFPVRNQKEGVILILVVLSPPVMLLADRGNFDTLILILLIITAKQMASGNTFLAYSLLLITVLLKFYTIPVFAILIYLSKNVREKFLGVCLLFASTWLAYRDIAITDTQYPHGSGAQFGFTVWGEYLNDYPSTQLNAFQKYGISLTIFLVVLLFVLYFSRRYPARHLILEQPLKWEQVAFFIFTIVSLTCFFGGMNFDYRLVYIAATLLLALKIFPYLNSTNILTCLLLVLWMSFPSNGLQPVGDLVLESIVAYSLVIFVTQFRRHYDKNLILISTASIRRKRRT